MEYSNTCLIFTLSNNETKSLTTKNRIMTNAQKLTTLNKRISDVKKAVLIEENETRYNELRRELIILKRDRRTLKYAMQPVETYYKRVVTEKGCSSFGNSIANTKSPGQYKGMSKEQFTEATRYTTVFTSEVIEL